MSEVRTSQHEMTIRKLCAEHPLLRRKGFAAFLRDLGRGISPDDFAGLRVHVVPDAWLVAPQIKTIVAVEVEDGKRVTDEKLRRYYETAVPFDGCDWFLYVATFDRFGLPLHEIDAAEGCLYQDGNRRPLPLGHCWQLF